MPQALVVFPFFFLLSSGTCAALSSCPTWLFSSGTLSFFLSYLMLHSALFPCCVLSLVAESLLCQLLLPSRPQLSFREAPVWEVQMKPGVVGQVSSHAFRSLQPM